MLQLHSGCALLVKLCWESGDWMVPQPPKSRGRTRSQSSYTRVILESRSRFPKERCRLNFLEAEWPACSLLNELSAVGLHLRIPGQAGVCFSNYLDHSS